MVPAPFRFRLTTDTLSFTARFRSSRPPEDFHLLQTKHAWQTKKPPPDHGDGLSGAERGGFEPPVPFPVHSISSAAQSATLPPLRACRIGLNDVRDAAQCYPYFPLPARRDGRRRKKIRGKADCIGAEADAALDEYLNDREDLQAGRRPQPTRRASVHWRCRVGVPLPHFRALVSTQLGSSPFARCSMDVPLLAWPTVDACPAFGTASAGQAVPEESRSLHGPAQAVARLLGDFRPFLRCVDTNALPGEREGRSANRPATACRTRTSRGPPEPTARSCQQLLNDVAADVRQPDRKPAEGEDQFLVVHAEGVQHGGVQVVDMDRIFDRRPA